ncbi:spore germination protein KB [Paenibacillus cellulosilyticus]|uniref:Spore germination protein KB n=1 Tax=Paenibacillus cellulosilyticus TaxID=375489 RepID=A0A2V2YWY0_9BACL|nr:GerAB/ArcD/ProY family transporter [Paenibacillus cellulosilyticus]PWW06257.1 spore germination protein KB [Paenibacillus cellulosilyticus]QKS42991.1 GerAB/ArcD/ProY family transporter [Paenibacillus cellulosilyticus]
MNRIGTYQLFVMVIMFHIGSTPLFQLGSKAKQDSWLAVLLGAAAGLLVMVVFVMLQQRKPDASLVGLMQLAVGRWAAAAIGLLYAVYFAYQSMRNVRDFGELTSLSLLQNHPKWLIMAVILLIAWYTVVNGNEAFFRTTQLLFIVMLASYCSLAILIVSNRLSRLSMLRPVMEEGPMPVVHAALPDIFSFPFTQGVIFLVFWKYVANWKAVRRASYWGYIASALFIVFMNAMSMTVLGPLAATSSLPFLEVVQLVQVGNFIERLDVVVTLLMFIGLYVKLTAFYLAAVLVLREIVRVRTKWTASILGGIIYAASFAERNNTIHLWLGLGISLKLSLVMQVAIPTVLLVLALLRLQGAERPAGAQTAAERSGG